MRINDGEKKLQDNHGGSETPGIQRPTHVPSLSMRATEVKLRISVEDFVQTGYTPSVIGSAVLAYFELMTVLLNFPIILAIRDNNGKLATDKYNDWFDSTNVLIKAFSWRCAISSVWFAVIVFSKDKILNFFSYLTSIECCIYMLIFKLKKTEV